MKNYSQLDSWLAFAQPDWKRFVLRRAQNPLYKGTGYSDFFEAERGLFIYPYIEKQARRRENPPKDLRRTSTMVYYEHSD